MPLITTTKMFADAYKGGYAVGAFNVNNMEIIQGIVEAAKLEQAPLILQVSAGARKYANPIYLRKLVEAAVEESNLPIALHLDHGDNFEICKSCVDGGFTSVMIDASHHPFEENIRLTKEVVEYAKFTGALVESEPHYFGGSSNLHTEDIDYEAIKKTFSTPEGSRAFIDATGIDTFAAAVGNLHGKYPVPKQLDLELLQQIRDAIPQRAHISLHGGSGTPLHFFAEAAKIGVSKVNINSDMRYAFRTTLEKVLADNPDQYAVVKIMEPVRQAVQAVVEEKIDAFGSAGKAVR